MPKIQQNIDLKPYNTFKVSAKAKFFVEVKSLEVLKEVLSDPKFTNEKKLILGRGANILFTKDFDGLVIKMEIKGRRVIKEDKDHAWLEVGAGEDWDEFVAYAVENNWGGIENLSDIPSSVGAVPVQNVGAYGVEVKDVIESVNVLNIDDCRNAMHCVSTSINNKDCQFGLRDSIFKNKYKDKYIITSVVFKLKKNPTKFNINYKGVQEKVEELNVETQCITSLQNVQKAIIEIRKQKLPDIEKIGSAGSFFTNILMDKNEFEELIKKYPKLKEMPKFEENGKIKVLAAWLIDQCGFKGLGKKQGKKVGAYEKQPLCLVNYGGATGKEILEYSKEIQKTVEERFGIKLKTEVNIY